jgi:hypothetical protein
MTVQQYIEKIIKKLNELIMQGKPNEISSFIKQLRKQIKLDKESEKLVKQALKNNQTKLENDYIEKFTKDYIAIEMQDITANFDKKILEIVKRGMKNNDFNKIIEQIKRQKLTSERYIKTVVNTAQKGISSAEKMQDAKSAGIQKFKYAGASTFTRQFCKDHLDKIYTIDEIEKMDNKQGLPVEFFCGGFNCRHRWVAVQE